VLSFQSFGSLACLLISDLDHGNHAMLQHDSQPDKDGSAEKDKSDKNVAEKSNLGQDRKRHRQLAHQEKNHQTLMKIVKQQRFMDGV
jgi:hypothetical protein